MLLRGLVLCSDLWFSNIISCFLEKSYLLLDPFLSGRPSRSEEKMWTTCLECVTARGPRHSLGVVRICSQRCSSHNAEREAEAHGERKKGLSYISYYFLSSSQKKNIWTNSRHHTCRMAARGHFKRHSGNWIELYVSLDDNESKMMCFKNLYWCVKNLSRNWNAVWEVLNHWSFQRQSLLSL